MPQRNASIAIASGSDCPLRGGFIDKFRERPDVPEMHVCGTEPRQQEAALEIPHFRAGSGAVEWPDRNAPDAVSRNQHVRVGDRLSTPAIDDRAVCE